MAVAATPRAPAGHKLGPGRLIVKPLLPLAATIGIPSIEVACSASILLER